MSNKKLGIDLSAIAESGISNTDEIIESSNLTPLSKDFLSSSCYKIGSSYYVVQNGIIHYSVNNLKDFSSMVYTILNQYGENSGIASVARILGLVLSDSNYSFTAFEMGREIFSSKTIQETVNLNGVKRDTFKILRGGIKHVKGANSDVMEHPFVKGYLKHAPYLEHLVTAIVCNYAVPHKQSFIALQKPASTGKSLELKALKDSGLTYEVTAGLKSLVATGGNSTVTAAHLVETISVAEDEFETFSIGLKKITQETEITEKFKTPVKVENLGLKLMFFADDETEIDMNDPQISSRVVKLNYKYSPLVKDQDFVKGTSEVVGQELLTKAVSYMAKKVIADIKEKHSYPYKIRRLKRDSQRFKNEKLQGFTTHVTRLYKESISEMIRLQEKSEEMKKAELGTGTINLYTPVQKSRFDNIMNSLNASKSVSEDAWLRSGLSKEYFFKLPDTMGADVWFLRAYKKNLPLIINMIDGKSAAESARRYRKTLADGISHPNIITKHTLKNRFKDPFGNWVTGIKIDFSAWEYSLLEGDESVPS